MSIILKRDSYNLWQIGLLKLSLLSISVAIGTNWPNVFQPYALWLVIIGVTLGLYLAYPWIRQ